MGIRNTVIESWERTEQGTDFIQSPFPVFMVSTPNKSLLAFEMLAVVRIAL